MYLYNLRSITKTRLYNFDPLKPHFYIVKLGYTRVYIIFLISAQKHRLWVLVRTAAAGDGGGGGGDGEAFQRIPTIYVLSRNMKNIRFCFIFIFLVVKFSIYFNRRVFVNSEELGPCILNRYVTGCILESQ